MARATVASRGVAIVFHETLYGGSPVLYSRRA